MHRPLLAVCLALLGNPLAAFAWGNDGHRIVGEIAYQRLGHEARAAVLDVLPNHGRYRTLFEGATWADTFARLRDEPRYKKLAPHHYVNGDSAASAVPTACGAEGCVVQAIRDNACLLRRDDAPKKDRLEALYLLAHFVGDVHQPLHVGHPDGRGGNRTFPSFFGETKNLHSIWDTELIEYHLHLQQERPDDEFEAEFEPYEPWDVYAAELDDAIGTSEASSWAAELDPHAWAEESLAAAKQHAFEVRSSWRLKESYYEQAMPVIRVRLQQAGVRLAAVLDAVFADSPLPYPCGE